MPRFLLISALVAAALAGVASAQQNTAAPEPLAKDIEALTQSQTDLLMKKDAAALAGLFTSDAVYATASGDVYEGQDRIHAYYSQIIPALGAFSRESVADEIHALGGGAWALGHGKTLVKTQDGVAELRDHWIAIYQLVDGKWRIRTLSLGENVTLLPGKY